MQLFVLGLRYQSTKSCMSVVKETCIYYLQFHPLKFIEMGTETFPDCSSHPHLSSIHCSVTVMQYLHPSAKLHHRKQKNWMKELWSSGLQSL